MPERELYNNNFLFAAAFFKRTNAVNKTFESEKKKSHNNEQALMMRGWLMLFLFPFM